MLHLSKLLSFLSSAGISPKKGLSQNFLIDQNIVDKIIETASVQPGDVVLEIGPGPGALTEKLLQKGASVIALEKDQVLANHLLRFQTSDQRLTVHTCDALTFPWETLSYDKVVANLPYHITTPLLEKCFATKKTPITCMIQKEVADRIWASHGTKTFGSLSLFIQFYARLVSRFSVSSHCFYPKPSVDSTVIHLEPHKTSYEGATVFFPLMHAAFQQRRKCISTSLQKFASAEAIKEALQSLQIRTDARPETLSLNDWLRFTQILMPNSH